ncbi:uncharacterized protein CTRU02_211852 [Colletotrichum truncatum]|uniref:Uncharacterized protein n=1 Tax=Colletotrichum truncatum TaxID=5467 RepID=A0ACC3YLV8_COLTU|nr:uncharacterized protein CTRU02_07262 [Colletotrichum truncatum]KAF6791500.1 hypothetical protein CTRU02_07262 [Colletotrichum truncatum]
MANVFRQATSWLYTGLAVFFLGTWSLIILTLVGMTALNEDPGLVQLIALPSLLTFLVAKLIVAATTPTASSAPRAQASGNLATWLATADNGSPHGALVLFLFSVSWLLYLARVVFTIFLLVLFGGFFLFASAMNSVDKEEMAAGEEGLFENAESRANFTTALVEFEEKIGFTFGESLQDKPWLIFQVVATIWAMSSLLMMYIVAYGFGALRKVLTTPMEAWSRGGVATPRIEGAQKNAAAVVVVEKETVVLPAGNHAAN